MSRAQIISRYGWVAVFPPRMPADRCPFPRLRLFRLTRRAHA